MSHDQRSPETVFGEAIQIDSPEQRAVFIERACADEPTLCREVRRLVEDHFRAGDFLEQPAVEVATIDFREFTEEPGTQIGPYKLREKIGEGGFGTVYVAEQSEPVRRKVALKIVKPGMDTREVIARFEAERQALAMMDHPNVAKVHDAGTTGSGRPYFVMELVHGIPITEFCDQRKLPVRERLKLFADVCRAVQHAHQKGIIHRDLKPSNVMVTLHDDKPVAKVIDFGVSKALSAKLTEMTVYTAYGQMVGTPMYMSPEQAQLSADDVDTRSDIYSLGVLLYELLTGTTPFDKETLQKSGFDEMRRVIREEEPPRPSARISTLQAKALSTVAEQRHVDPRKLSHSLRGELDWIVMKALEKDRNRRYETANGLARDVQRHLNDEPVHARPPSTVYRLSKFARRNKGLFTAAAVVGITLVLGIVGTSWQAIRATKAEGIAGKRLGIVETQKVEIEQEKQKAIAQAERATTKAAIAKAVNDFLNDDLLGMGDAASQAEGGLSPDPNIKLRTLLDRAAQQIEGRFPEQPQVEAAIRRTLGETYRAIGAYDEAEKQLRRAVELHAQELGEHHRTTLISKNNLALVFSSQGDYDQAEKLHRQTLKMLRQTLGEEHPHTLKSQNNLATVYRDQGRYSQAEKLHQQTLEIRRRMLGEDHPETVASRHNLALVYSDQGRYSKAEELSQQTLELKRRTLGEEHPDTLQSMNHLANVYFSQGRYSQAEELHQQTLEIRRRTLGEDHPATLHSMNNLANVYCDQGRNSEAEKLYKKTVELHRRTLGEEHPVTLRITCNLAAALESLARHAEAERLYRRVMEVSRRTWGPERFQDEAMKLPGIDLSGQIVLPRLEEHMEKLRKSDDAIDLLSKVEAESSPLDLAPDVGRVQTINGRVERVDGTLRLSENSKAMFPLRGRRSYLLRVRLTRNAGTADVGFLLPVGEETLMLTLSGWKGARDALWWIDDHLVARKSRFENGRSHLVEVLVDAEGEHVGIYTFLDGQRWLYWQGERPRFRTHENNAIPRSGILGMYNQRNKVVVHSMTATRVEESLAPLRSRWKKDGASDRDKRPEHPKPKMNQPM